MTRHVRDVPLEHAHALVHPGWRDAFPWLVQGTTTRGRNGDPFDLGLFSGGSPEDDVLARWDGLVESTRMEAAVHARQPHGTVVRPWPGRRDAGEESAPQLDGVPGSLNLVEPCDGHATDRPGVLLGVTTADCVPVFVVDPERRAVAMIHAGWRGAAQGILEEGLTVMASSLGTRPGDVHVHLGPAICGACYEVGPEVFQAFGLEAPAGPEPLDVRGLLARRAVAAGVMEDRVSVSSHCTRCTGSELFSHRGGDAGRQVGYLGVRR